METISIDVMVMGGVKYYCTLSFLWDRKKAITEKWIRRFVISKRPTLKYREFRVEFNYRNKLSRYISRT